MKKPWRPFTEARAFAHTLGLKSKKEWDAYARSTSKPADIPRQPRSVYGADFRDWGDWLGTGTVATFRRTFLPFAEARAFVHTLGLKSQREWNAYRHSGNRPANIPAAPALTYRDEFQSWGDWLGTGTVAPFLREYLPFAEARAFVHRLGLKSRDEWDAYCQSGQKPENIPANPRIYRSSFVSMGDWLGTGLVATQLRIYLPFAEARAFVHSLGFKKREEWRVYCQSGQKPENIPVAPERVYKGQYAGIGDWLGTDYVSTRNRTYRPFAAARAYVRALGLKNQRDWAQYCKSGRKPADIPRSPRTVYASSFVSWGDWLGTDYVASVRRQYLPFVEARAYVHALGLRSEDEWLDYCHSGALPDTLPMTPRLVYGEQFVSMGDWLGTGTVASYFREYLPFEEARAFVRGLGLASAEEWHAFSKSGAKPENIPADPYHVYGSAFRGMGDWLGTFNKWSKKALLALLADLKSQIRFLSERELYLILRRRGATAALRLALGDVSTLQVIQRVSTEEQVEVIERALRALTEEDFPSRADGRDTPQLIPEEIDQAELAQLGEPEDFPPAAGAVPGDEDLAARGSESLHVVDRLAAMAGGIEDEVAEALVDSRVRLLWERYSNEGPPVVDAIQDASGGAFFNEIKQRFLAEVQAIEALTIPTGWSFATAKGAEPAPPNAMQRRIAWLVRERRRIGNWSVTGSGKTISAVLAARVCDARVTLVITNYATLEGWQRQILAAYPDSRVYRQLEWGMTLDREHHSFLVLNYEQFQTKWRGQLVEQLLAVGLDFVVLDEVHLIKQRDYHVSLRLQAIKQLLRGAAEHNVDLRVLGMSATPVINNLTEAKHLLEVIAGEPFTDLDTAPTVNNALAVHQALLQQGHRYRARYEQEMRRQMIVTVRNDLIDALQQAGETVLTMERALLSAKLEAARAWFRKGTIVYTYYVEGMVAPACQYLTDELGLRVGRYTGDDKSGLQRFLEGRLDVLVGSKPLATGLDGLQTVCDRLVLLSLPWTGAEYEHLIGRIRRQGSAFGEVDIIVPQVVLDQEGQRWSWDERRWKLIHYKRTLSDCAVDGRIPATVRVSPQILLRESRKALDRWIRSVFERTAV